MSDSREGLNQTVTITNSRLPLLKAAIRLFAEKGFEGASIREIADTAGVNSSLISFHFGGKSGLHAAALHLACRMAKHTARTLPVPPSSSGTGPVKSAVYRQAVLALRAYIREFIRMSLHHCASRASEQEPELERAVLVFIAKSMIYPPRGIHGKPAGGPAATHRLFEPLSAGAQVRPGS